jgi:hypothetical protein
METAEPYNPTRYAADCDSMQPPSAHAYPPIASANVKRSASRGFSLTITLRLRPFAFTIAVTPAPEADKRLGSMI